MSKRAIAIIVLKVLGVLAVVVGAPLAGMLLVGANDAHALPGDLAGKAPLPAATVTSITNDFVAVLLPPQMANLQPRADGKVLEIRVKPGQPVKKGDVIVAFDLRERKHDLAIALAQLKAAQAESGGASAEYSAAKARFNRRKNGVMIDGKAVALVSGEEQRQALADMQGAAAKIATAGAHIAEQKAHVDQIKIGLQESELLAPFDGMVSSVNFEPGMTAHTGDVVARIVGGQGLRTRIAVPEDALVLLKAKRAKLTLDDRVLLASIDQVTPEVEPASRSFVVEGAVDTSGNACPDGCGKLAGRPVRASLVQVGE